MLRIGKYEIINELGRGPMGTVYKAKEKIKDRVVAIKTITLKGAEPQTDSISGVTRSYSEPIIFGKFIHPNIAQIHEEGNYKENPFTVMEYIEGVNLEKVIAGEKKLSIKEKCKVLIQIANALDFAHQKGAVHRNLKPSNIMVSNNLKAKIMDFGTGKIISRDLLLKTQIRMLVGNPAYLAPEQLTSGKLNRQTDVFSFGVLAYETLTGDKLFPASDFSSLVQDVTKKEIPFPQEINPDIPRDLGGAIHKSLEREKAKRSPSVGELTDALEILLHRLERKQSADAAPQMSGQVKNLVQFLKERYTFFYDFTDEELRAIFSISNKKVYKDGEMIFEEETLGKTMYVIISGDVRITKRFGADETVLNRLRAGDCFGEMGIIGSTPRFATATANSDCVLLAINEVILRNSEPKLCLKLYKNLSLVLSEKLKKSDSTVNRQNLEIRELKKQCLKLG